MKKIYIILVLIMITIIAFFGVYYTIEGEKIKQSIYNQSAENLQDIFKEEVNQKQGRTAAMTYVISQNPTIVQALLEKDNSLIDMTDIIKGIEHYGEHKNLWIQVIDKNGYSFYRSWTNKVGDSVAKIRVDVEEMINDPKPMKNISTGRFDMTFKTMLPLFKDKEFIGMIEMISHFNSIHNELKNKKITPLFLVDKSYTPKFIKPFTGLFIDDYYVANKEASPNLMEKVQKSGIERFLDIDDYLIFENYLVTTYKIQNIKNQPMGYFVLFKPIKFIDMGPYQEFHLTMFKRVAVVMTIFGLLILLYINRNFVKTLNKEVKEKTAKIRIQKENLKRLLDIYDQHVIFSKTDTKGIITHASEAFCKISGYSKNELIGHPHNIIRHKDMPQETFKYLWEQLKKEKTVNVEVKNRKKDGGYYWVDAEIAPDYDAKGNLIGYVAIRDEITANKDIEEIQKEIIFTMGSIGESRSKETGNHVRRVAEYSKLLAILYGMSKEEAELLKQASPMHDIGKVAIPDSILNKPGKLNATEMTIMQTHALKGYDMLKVSSRALLKNASIIALQHHEKWDGSGYPTGLKGEDIHIYGRITAIADVFDALGSDRCYKKAWEDERIFAFFKEQKGKHFDPKLIDLFFDNIESFLNIRDTYKDVA
jgi:PAS domain S-box-containing protein